ncbi:MAG: surface lipoprotein assembly modifier [Rhodospirillales bacterium]|nr:surface lipoprotein assembly modifier [Rhodospirillales bacterium]
MRILAAALILLLALPASAQDMPALFRQGMEALAAADKTKDEDRRDELLDGAIAAFRKMLIADPRLVRVRLELARAFFLKGEDGLAREHFERVLAGKPPAGVALNVQRFLAQIRARKRWSMRVGFALAPDTNLGAGSDDRTIYIEVFGQRLPFTYQGDEPKSGIGIAAWAGGEYQHPLSRTWRLRAGGDVHRREYREREFDRMTVAGHVGPRWLIGRGTEASLLASVRQHWTADEADHRDIGARGELRHRLSRRATGHVTLSRHERRYEERDHLDGPVTDLSLGAGWVASPTIRIDAAVGWGREKPETERYRHERRWMRLGATAALPYGFTVGASGTLRWTGYEGNWFPFTEDGSARSDITRHLRVFAHNRAFTVGGFSPQVSLVREDRTSNAQLHDYERTSGELRFVRLF